MFFELIHLTSPMWPWEYSVVPSIEAHNNSNTMEQTTKKDNDKEFSGTNDTNVAIGEISRIKVGFFSAFFFRHSVGRLLGRVIAGLNQNKFDVHVIQVCCCSSNEDNL